MWLETHRCAVDGCPNLAAYDVRQYDLDLFEGAVLFAADQECPTICVEHALENERTAGGERRPGPGFSVYLQLEPHYADAPTAEPLVT